MRNNLIIFSKDRACQLHLLLESINVYSNGLFDRVTVIYKASSEDFALGYDKIKKQFNTVVFTKEVDFYNDTLNSIDNRYEFTTFMVDDDVFYDEIKISKEKIFKSLNKLKGIVSCFSLRLGLNCNYSHPANLKYQINRYDKVDDFIIVNVWEQRGDFAYPLALDGHIFDTNLVTNLFKNIGKFNNPNMIESQLQYMKGKIQKGMLFFDKSVLVGIPVNIVNDTHKNRNGLEFSFSETELNDRYLDREKIDLSALDFSNINGPHKEIEYKFCES